MPTYIQLDVLLICTLAHHLQAIYYPQGYKGCFVDSWNRVLDIQLADSYTNSGGKCKGVCIKLQYRYAGTQYGKECFCGHDAKRYEKRPDSECNITCPGNSYEYCGGDWRISIYDTGYRNGGSMTVPYISIPTAVFVMVAIVLVIFCIWRRCLTDTTGGNMFRLEETQINRTHVSGQISILEEGQYTDITLDSSQSSSVPYHGYITARIPSLVSEQ